MSSNNGTSDRRLTITSTKWKLHVTGYSLKYPLKDFMETLEEFYKEFRFHPTWTADHYIVTYQITGEMIAESYFDVHVRTKEAAEWYQTKYDNKQLEPNEKMGIGRHVYLRAQIEEVGHFGESKLKEEEGGKEPDGGIFRLELD
jgi:hypothetical protein